MDEVAIMEKESIGKRAKVVIPCDARLGEGAVDSLFSSSPSSSSASSASSASSSPHFKYPNFCSLPVELILEILSYLSQLDLCNMACVSLYFKSIVRDPVVWRSYEVPIHSKNTSKIIEKLRQMTFLRELKINRRQDSDEILRQIPLTNKNLEKLSVYNCTGSTSKYLRSRYLTRILKKCRRLHTIEILGSPFRGRKFYRLLGEIASRLKFVSVPITASQFSTFAEHARIEERDRLTDCTKYWSYRPWRRRVQLWYSMVRKTVSYRTIYMS